MTFEHKIDDAFRGRNKSTLYSLIVTSTKLIRAIKIQRIQRPKRFSSRCLNGGKMIAAHAKPT